MTNQPAETIRPMTPEVVARVDSAAFPFCESQSINWLSDYLDNGSVPYNDADGNDHYAFDGLPPLMQGSLEVKRKHPTAVARHRRL
jgi:hypothetical protein